uniref:Head decoration protein n=1 Tax=Dinoroseobacter phage vB_DshS_R26L TaxID=3161158 RepID=A0AAU7VGT0_9CAUD
MTFYPNLRDNTAGPLIEQFGQPGTYRVYGAEVYDNTTGKTTKGAPTDTTVSMLDLPIKERVFTEEVTKKASAFLLVSAKEFAAAGVTPAVDEHIIFGSKTYRILAMNVIGPSGVAVAYKMAVQYA